MTARAETLEKITSLAGEGYKYGFFTDIENEQAPLGLNEGTVRFISAKKKEPQWLLEWRLQAFRDWQKMEQPDWAKLLIAPINYQAATYYSAPKQKAAPKSLDEVDPELLRTYEKLGIPLREQQRFQGIAVDAVFDSVSVATTFKAQLAKLGIIFGSFGEAVQEHPQLVRKYLGSVVPQNDNFFAALNSAVFSDGSFAFIPPGVRCPLELSTYFRINAANTGQFERTLIVAEKGSYVKLPRRLHRAAARRKPASRGCGRTGGAGERGDQILDGAELVPGRRRRARRHLQFRHQARRLPGRQLEDLLDPSRDRLRHHLEVPELHPRGRQLGRRVLLRGHYQQPAAGRYRD